MKDQYFRGKNAVITGAASGIGKEIAIQLSRIGTNLVISDINEEKLEEVKKIAESHNVKVISFICDVTKRAQVSELAKKAISEFKEIHFLFSNAGIAVGGHFEDIDNNQWKRIININVWGMIYVIKAFISKLREQGFGHVVVISSISGCLGIGGLIPDSTTKFANKGFCEALYGEYHNLGIDVSLVCPFPLNTSLMDSAGIGVPPNLFDNLDAESAKKGLEEGKRLYWEKFIKKKFLFEGFGGGMELEKAVGRYLKKIRKKKFYIFERRLGRLSQTINGTSIRLYKKILNIFGQRHIKLIDEINETVRKLIEKN